MVFSTPLLWALCEDRAGEVVASLLLPALQLGAVFASS
jgi:hypothetical protein